jgi:hypothetical protein
MKRIALLVIFEIVSASLSIASAPTVYDKRVINYHTVDLLPLFVWWDHQKGVRPLSAWKHLQGILDRETPYGWLCRGYIEGQPGLHYFLLKNPPKTELARYHELEGQLPELEREKSDKLELASQPTQKTWSMGLYSNSSGTAENPAYTLPVENADEINEAKGQVQEIDAHIAGVRQEMGSMLTKRGYFKIDGFALKLNEVYQGSPVFDFGYPQY